MTKHDYKQNAYYLIYLIRCVLHKKSPSKEKLSKMDLSQLYQVANAHSLTAMAAYALESAGIYDKAFEEAKYKAIRKNILLDTEREKVCAELEKAGIWYMPLKGVILKELYPAQGMREMCDNDILFDKSHTEEVKRIMADLGFEMKHDDFGHDLEFLKKPVSNFEMHTELFGIGHDPTMNEYYDDVRRRLIIASTNSFELCFTKEDFYIFITAHEYKHFSNGGTGLRNLIDRYIYLNFYYDSLDYKYIKNEHDKLGIDDYNQKSKQLAFDMLDGKKLSGEEKEMLDYYIFSGAYGNYNNSINNKVKKFGDSKTAKLKYVLNRLLVPINENDPLYIPFRNDYPLFYKYRILLPILPVYRVFCGIINRRKKVLMEIKTLIHL